MLKRIDLSNPCLTAIEVEAISLMLNKREQYVYQGRGREAHGAGTMILMLWNCLTGSFPNTQPTNWGEL